MSDYLTILKRKRATLSSNITRCVKVSMMQRREPRRMICNTTVTACNKL